MGSVKRKKKFGKFCAIMLYWMMVALTIGIMICVDKIVIPSGKLSEAEALIEKGDYNSAADILYNSEKNYKNRDLQALLEAIDCIEELQYDKGIKKAIENGTSVCITCYEDSASDGEIYIFDSKNEYNGLPVLQKTGYWLKQWDLQECNYDENTLYVDLFAQWSDEYKITYDLAGGNAQNPTSYHYMDSDIVLNQPTKDGFNFLGWIQDGDETAQKDVVISEGSYGDKKFVALWENIIYNISLDADGGECDTESIDVSCGDKISLPVPVREFYTFCGWSYNDLIIDADTWKVADSVTLKAIWEPTAYSINYVLDGGINPEESVNWYTVEDNTVTLASPQKKGYSFKGWYSDSEFKNKITEIDTKNCSDITLYAKWKILTYKITLNAAGGVIDSEDETTISVKYGEKFTLPTPTRENYEFVGWYNENKKYSSGTWENTSGITLTAKWEAVLYSINYELNGGTGDANNPSVYSVESGELKVEEPSKNGYEFAGWYFDSDFTEPFCENGNMTDITLYAKWNLIVYNITYEMNSGKMSGNMVTTYTIEDLPLKLPVATRNKMLFVGWNIVDSSGECITEITEAEMGVEQLVACFMDQDLTLKLSRDETYYYVAKYSGDAVKVVIPSHYKGKPVKKIGSYAFSDSSKVVTVVVPDTVVEIGDHAFSGCDKLLTINIPNGVTQINDYTFYHCDNLKEIELPDSVEAIEDYAFAECRKLTSVKWPYVLETLGSHAFYNCERLKITVVPDCIQILNDYVFAGCTSITQIEIISTVTTIRNWAFSGCTNLTKVIIPDSVKQISYYAFYDCNKVTFYCESQLPEDDWNMGWNQDRTIKYGYMWD